ncbi:MAG: metallophosphoesterase [Candidatus Dormibacterales bacterium]
MASGELPVLIAGDVHGDLERLFASLKPYPADQWHTIFLGDLVDFGPFGVGALRYARDRPNTDVLLGNHEVMMLWALRDPARVGFWMSVGGQRHDLDELARDAPLQEWLRTRPGLLTLADGTLVQHAGHDGYQTLIAAGDSDPAGSANTRIRELLGGGGEAELWDMISARNIFPTQPARLDRWLEITGSHRVVFGHTPHRGSKPESYHGGRALNYDGGLSRWHRQHRHLNPVGATVAPLPERRA